MTQSLRKKRGTGISLAAFETETAALIARFTTPPTAGRKAQINRLIRALKVAGIWSKLDALYLMAAADAQAAQRNWIADQYNLSEVSAPTFTADRGYAGNGTSSYLSTGFTPSSAPSPRFTQNSSMLGVWSRTDIAQDSCDIGARTVNASQDSTIFIRNTSNLFLNRLNSGSGSGIAPGNSASLGMYAAVRPDASNLAAYGNGVLISSGASASVAVSTRALNIGARDDVGTFNSFSTRQYAAAFIGAALSAAEMALFYSALNNYLAAIGAA